MCSYFVCVHHVVVLELGLVFLFVCVEFMRIE